jgi:formamidopyrimidine-DNA glycosylase
MPELPEVETVVRSLNQYISGQKILSTIVTQRGLRTLGKTTPEHLDMTLKESKVIGVQRVGKFIVIKLNSKSPNKWVVAHLRMTGNFIYESAENRVNAMKSTYLNGANDNSKYIQLTVEFEHGKLYFLDKRRFGTFHLHSGELQQYAGITNIGIDALDSALTADYLLEKLKGRTKSIYAVIMDQSIIAGVGNIYANEVLFRVGINPLSKANNVPREQLIALVEQLQALLLEAIANKGTSFSDFKNSEGKKGKFQKLLNVYGRKNTVINGKEYEVVRQKIGGRSVFHIPELSQLY